jgi:hypothetical protein
MTLHFDTATGPLDIAIDRLIVAGWTGRDAAAVHHHIDELAALGVAPPAQVPLFYRVGHTLLTTGTDIEVLGPATSGEAEPLLIRHQGALWLGLASDHTDRALEAHSVAASKQSCPKPCAAALWPWDSVADRLDTLRIRSWIRDADDDWQLYQDGTLGQIRPLDGLIATSGMTDGAAMLCGTFAAIGGVRPARDFRATMDDPATGREIRLEYRATALPIVA